MQPYWREWDCNSVIERICPNMTDGSIGHKHCVRTLLGYTIQLLVFAFLVHLWNNILNCVGNVVSFYWTNKKYLHGLPCLRFFSPKNQWPGPSLGECGGPGRKWQIPHFRDWLRWPIVLAHRAPQSAGPRVVAPIRHTLGTVLSMAKSLQTWVH